MPAPSRPGLREIAREAGCSQMTVSRAINNAPRVSEATKARILEIAARLGYRPDPKVSSLMAHLRQSRASPHTGVFALLWPDATPSQVSRNALLAELQHGAETRAATFGYQIETFHLAGTELTPARLDRMLYSRGIVGVILGPVSYHVHRHLSMKWARYSAVSIGLGLWRPAFHQVHHNHYRSMMELMRHLRHRGCRRIALQISEEAHRRMFGAWWASFLAHHPLPPAEAAKLIFLNAKEKPEARRRWWKTTRADALILDNQDVSGEFERLGCAAKVQGATLQWRVESAGFAGIDQRYDLQGAYAVDMVMAQLQRAERGVPESPKVMLAGGQLMVP